MEDPSRRHNGDVAPRGPQFILSIDLELAWGVFAYGGLSAQARHLDAERDVIKRLLALLDIYRVPATWATVGHLFLESCRREGDSTHPEVMRPRYGWYPHDWHHLDPGTDVRRDPLWYGSDVIAQILAARTAHEIGTHTFSHIVVDDPACDREMFRSQLRACRALHEKHGLPLRSIVYPNNRVGHVDVLAEEGILAYRGVGDSWYGGLPRPLARAGHLVDRMVAVTPPTYSLANRIDGSVVDLPASMFLLARDGVRRLVPLASRRLQAHRGLRRAVERGEIFHLWFHPFNLATDAGLFDVLADVLAEVAGLRDQGRLEVATMGDLGARLATAA